MRILIIMLMVCAASFCLSQNIQLHYDFGKAYNEDQKIERKFFTSTVEFFKPDSLGSTFLFIDFDYNKGNGGASLGYFELARKFYINKNKKLSLQIEFNDGTPVFIRQAWLAGISYPIKIGDFIVHTSFLYRGNKGAKNPDGQLTLVWFKSFLKAKIVFTGFLDIWTQDKTNSNDKEVVFLTEPQIWYVLNKHFSIGSEIEISRNFFTFDKDFEIMPTAALKWTL